MQKKKLIIFSKLVNNFFLKSLFFLQEVQDHLEGKADLRAICESREKEGGGLQVALPPQKRVVSESLRKWGTVDTQDVRETSKVQVSKLNKMQITTLSPALDCCCCR